MARYRSREAETEDVNQRRLQRGAVKRQHLGRWAVGRDELAPGIVGDVHLAPGSVGENHLSPGLVDALRVGESVTLTGTTMDGTTLVWSTIDTAVARVGFDLLALPATVIPTSQRAYYTATLELELAGETGATVEVWADDILKHDYTGPALWQFLDSHIFHLGPMAPTPVEIRVTGATSVAHRVTVELVDLAAVLGQVFSLIIAGGLDPALAVADVNLYKTDGTLSVLASMPAARADAGVFRLDGGVYVAGGMPTDESSHSTSLYRYSPDGDVWATLASMTGSRRQPASAAVGGVGYIFGGATGASTVLDTCQKYNPSTDTWSAVTAMPGGVRNHHRAAVVDGLIHVIGGNTTSGGSATGRHEVYDPATSTWTTATVMPTARWGFAIGVHDDQIYACGGRTAAAPTDTTVVEVYNPATDTWTTGPSMPATATYAGHATIGSNLVLLGAAAIYILDMDAGEWTIADVGSFPSVPAVALL